jgi:hypothetical protein
MKTVYQIWWTMEIFGMNHSKLMAQAGTKELAEQIREYFQQEIAGPLGENVEVFEAPLFETYEEFLEYFRVF